MNALIICNPRAGRQEGTERVRQAIRVLESAGWSVTVEQSNGPGDATRLARFAVTGKLDAVLVAGGDGTLNEAVQGIAGSDTALGTLPYGTVNVWARELAMPLNPVEAAHAIVDGRIERIDLGLTNGRYFMLMTGIGLDGEIVRRAQALKHHKRRFGILPYVAAVLLTVPRYRGADLELRYDGLIRRVHAVMVIIGNTRLYGGRFYLTPSAVATDGRLDVCMVKGRGPLAFGRHALPLILAGRLAQGDVEVLRVRQLEVTADSPLAVQADGELIGTTPTTIEIQPRALR
ncbi:MAG: diacylglycerol kinase, partial [Chloroflexi bacterium]